MESRGAEREDYSSSDIENPSIPLVTSIREMIDCLPPLSAECCIYRVPENLRQVNEKAYTPQKVSIGPLHHGKQKLLAMEEQKLRYLRAFLDRTQLSLENCIRVIREWEERARNYYAEIIKLGSDEFVKMILVDSSFIIEIIWRYNFLMQENNTDYLSYASTIVSDVRVDMILLENQLPFFVLEGLFNLAFPSSLDTGLPSFTVLSIKYFKSSLISEIPIQAISNYSEVKHFVDLLRLCHLPSSLRSLPADSVQFVPINTATDLQEVGLRFKRGSSNHLLDIQYTKEVLEIPQVRLQDGSEFILRNIIALEQCLHIFDSYIIDYVVFMDTLIGTAKDVDLLIQNGSIVNYLSDSSAVATFFQSLTKEVLWRPPNYYYHGVCQNLNAHYKVPWHRWKATLKRDYFSTPWRTASTIAAVILLVLTLMQTVCSIISL